MTSEEYDREETDQSPTSIDSHTVDVILTTDPDEEMGYGREKYTTKLVHDDDGLRVLYCVEHRWKGNFWRDIREWDWCDVPHPVRERVASVVDCDGVDDLNPGVRLIGEGGRCSWTHRQEDDDDC